MINFVGPKWIFYHQVDKSGYRRYLDIYYYLIIIIYNPLYPLYPHVLKKLYRIIKKNYIKKILENEVDKWIQDSRSKGFSMVSTIIFRRVPTKWIMKLGGS